MDDRFSLPCDRYGLVFLLGVLYHLKNPFYTLETLSKHSRYCILSTRVAALLTDRQTRIRDAAVAYLVDEDELNRDYSNYWIFSECGLRRLLQRTNWDIREYLRVGETQSSDPVGPDHDERVFCLAESTFGLANLPLLDGWYVPEKEGWRWTGKAFSAVYELPAAQSAGCC